MKKLLFFVALTVVFGISSCEEKKSDNTAVEKARVDSLQRVIAQKDNEMDDMLSTLNEIQEGLRLVAQAENNVSVLKSGEGVNKSAQIKENIQQISDHMKRNRELVAKLRKQLRESSLQSDKLQETIDGLVRQLDDKEQELAALRDELSRKDIHIAELDATVGSLNSDVTNLTAESQQKSQTISRQDKALNTAWYVFGTKRELKDQHIIEGDRVLQSNFNQSYFTKVDIRVDKEIKLYSKTAKVLTSHPASSYTLQQDANKQYVLRITNPELFWTTSKYLVVLVK